MTAESISEQRERLIAEYSADLRRAAPDCRTSREVCSSIAVLDQIAEVITRNGTNRGSAEAFVIITDYAHHCIEEMGSFRRLAERRVATAWNGHNRLAQALLDRMVDDAGDEPEFA